MTDKASIYQALRPGMGVIISFGLKGEQYAHVVNPGREHKRIRVWRVASRSWTKPRPLWTNEIIRFSTNADAAKFGPEFGLAWERD